MALLQSTMPFSTAAAASAPLRHYATPTDPALPQLGEALDPACMGRTLAQAVLGTRGLQERFRLRSCTIMQIRYKPGKNCLITYQLTLHDELEQCELEQLLSARIFEPGGSLARFRKAQQQPLVVPRVGPAILHLPALEMVLWAFPNDRKLTGLPALRDDTCLRTELAPLVTADLGPHWRIDALRSRLVHYVAEHTCTIAVELDLHQPTTGALRTATLYGKTYDTDAGAAALAQMRELWQGAAHSVERWTMAEPLGYAPASRTLWQRGLHGATLHARLQHDAAALPLVAQAAAAVAALHQAPATGLRAIDVGEIVRGLYAAEQTIVRARPGCAPTLRRVVERLAGQADALAAQPCATLHGDLHLQNVFVMPTGVALIDLDNLCEGPPLHDVGSFVAGMYGRGLLGDIPEPAVHTIVAEFVRSYARHVPWAVDDAPLGWFVAAALVGERALRCVTRLKAGRLASVDELVALADRICHAQPALLTHAPTPGATP